MTKDEDLLKLYQKLDEMQIYVHTMHILNYDISTASPIKGMEDTNRDINLFSEIVYKLQKDEKFINLVKKIKNRKDFSSLNVYDRRLIELLDKDIERNKKVTKKFKKEADEVFTNAYVSWLKAKNNNSYKEFEPTLKKVYEIESKRAILENSREKNLYNTIFNDYEEGFTTDDLDIFFDEIERELVPLVSRIRNAKYQPRHDFINRKVPIYKQEQFSKFLLEKNGYDFSRGTLSKTEHPFTDQLSYNDVRVTTHYYEDNFISNMYSIIHEGGHALFGQNVPKEVFTHRLGESCLTMAKHESVSRFYENVVGRSKEYLSSIYPTFRELFKDEFSDVTLNDLYEGVNYVDFNNSIRTEADELTYSLHILIRYKLERKIMVGKVDFKNLNEEWNRLYKEILGVDVKDDKEGILQDVHWSSGFGYFPTYALGNALNCMYVKKLDQEIYLADTVQRGRMDLLLQWMSKNVFAKAPLYDTKTWIKKITGEEFSAKPYIEYLKKKFLSIYHLI
mgnify:CR=1 FL=1